MHYQNLRKGAIGVSILFAVWGCGRFSRTTRNARLDGNENSVASEPAANSAKLDSGSPRSDLLTALQNRSKAPSYRMEGTITSSNGRESTIIMEFQSPDRFHIIRNGNAHEIGTENGEMMSIAGDTWVKTKDGSWKKSPVHIDLAQTIFGGDSLDALVSDSTATVKLLGTESLNGSEMKVYQYTSEKKDEDNGGLIKETGKYWIGGADGRPYKMEGEYEMNEMGKNLTSNVTGTFDYNASVKIEPPQ